MSDKEYYSPADFDKSPKYDAHLYYHTFDDVFRRKAKRLMFILLINTVLDSPIDKYTV